MAQEPSSPRQKLKFGLHVHVYVFLTILLLGLGVSMLAGTASGHGQNQNATLVGAVSGVVIFGAVVALVARYCGSEVVSYFDGLRLIAAYMSIGIGPMSLVFSFVCIGVCILFSTCLTVLGVVSNNRSFAQRQFLLFLQALSKHRMYQ